MSRLQLLPLCLLLSVLTQAQNPMQVIHTESGLVSGVEEDSIHIFKGIPFAAPPVGNLRWKEPQSVKRWSGVKACTAFQASPMQGNPSPFLMFTKEFMIPAAPISEDCLYVNVWTGAGSPAEKRPVLIFIYGGGFMSGGSAVPVYDGTAMAEKGVVFVTFNYRVGVFGFFAHPELTKESIHHASGNYGLLDQIAALKWVRRNIAAFGGDPSNVTIAGQSAGSISVNCLVASPLAKGLFKKAIAESGAIFVSGGLGYGTLERAEQAGSVMGDKLKSSSLDELRSIPAETLQHEAHGTWAPIVDGYVLPESIEAVYAEGRANKVSLLMGWNENDGFQIGAANNATVFHQQMARQYGGDSTAFFQAFPAVTDSEAAEQQAALARDLIFGAQGYAWANAQSERSKVYLYRFARRLPAVGDMARYGAFHAGEIAYAYHNLSFLNRPWEKVDFDLESVMSSYWVNFAATGDPNGKGLPPWPAYDEKGYHVMILDEQPHGEPLPDKAGLDFLYARMKEKNVE
jgi:para-nitrobenzyl esterase